MYYDKMSHRRDEIFSYTITISLDENSIPLQYVYIKRGFIS